jgi:hypothetical protein
VIINYCDLDGENLLEADWWWLRFLC